MKRLGFVKLAPYGLLLTPEGRIMSLRPAVLEDGLGGRIVGWRDGDLAAMELQKWEPARPASNQAIATRVAVATPQRWLPRDTPTALSTIPEVVAVTRVAPVAPVTPVAAAVATPAAPVVAATAEVDEDDWQWVIALARARAVAEESEAVAQTFQPPSTPRRRADTVPPPVSRTHTRQMPAPQRAAATVNPIEHDAWPKTEPLGSIDYVDTTPAVIAAMQVPRRADGPLAAPTRKLATMLASAPPPPSAPTPPSVVRTVPRASTSPATIIPIPKLPTTRTTRTGQLQPVVRAMPTPIPPLPPRRFPTGTGPITTPPGMALRPPSHATEEPTRPAIAIGERTATSVIQPAAARTVLPSIKQRMAR
ncbi:MAG: hypothetical protein M3680_22570 [Myxococcota bacterium]|nr:hypothetical protein [Myxococcota bacterium]